MRTMKEGKLFAVDEWNCSVQAFFLTHCHADHTHGLNSHWSRGPLFCSDITASLLLSKFDGFDASLLHPLPLGSPSLIPIRCNDSQSRILLEVTPIDASHCPGSVMYVFRGHFGCIVHTGDFRWEIESLSDEDLQERKQQLLAAVGGAPIDRLYLDNTFCNPRFSFPPRHIAAMQVVEIIANHQDYDVVIAVDNLGKEELLLYLAEAFKTKIWVWPERLQTLRVLGFPDVFTTDTSVTRIRAVPRYSISNDTLQMMNKITPTIAVLPTGCVSFCKTSRREREFQTATNLNCLKCCIVGTSSSLNMGVEDQKDCLLSGQQIKALSWKQGRLCHKLTSSSTRILAGGIYLVQYSLHCCFSELKDFVKFINPVAIVGILKSRTYDINPTHHFAPSKEFSDLNFIPLEKFPSHLKKQFKKTKDGKDMALRYLRLCKVLRHKKRRRGVILSSGASSDDE